ncbi:MAG: flagellar biosynthesis protein FlhF [Elusimicrobia bacterium RIFOXYB2_FULL_49_7]|nr:MAG: flagellar biosynthesis protein FlhF [Elusimicrobia bacterium RIFOXYB2_FULL_49_7]
MKIKKFTSRSMKEGLLLVKAELGPDAVILNTRKVGGLSPFSGEKIEITAALDENSFARPNTSVLMEKETATYSPRNLKRAAAFQGQARTATAEMDPPTVSDTSSRTTPDDFALLKQDLDRMKNAVYSIAERVRSKNDGSTPEAISVARYLLEQNEVEPVLVDDLIGRLKRTMPESDLSNRTLLRNALLKLIQEDVVLSGHIAKQSGTARRIALVGPTGVGKTTSIAKLASHFRLLKNMNIALIAADNYRMAAIEQIQAFAAIAGLPVEIVFSEEEMRSAVRKFDRYDLVFIDTAGRSQRNSEHMQDLKRVLTAAEPDETHLVVSLTTKSSDMKEIARSYGETGFTHLLYTKLDETLSYGSLYNLAMATKRPLSYLSTGQNVPDDLRVASAREIANLIAGGGEI